MIAGNGEVVWSAKYNSFGKATVEVAIVENNLRFPGQYKDNETGLYYNRFRFFDTEMGRYLRIDPIYEKLHLKKSSNRIKKKLLFNLKSNHYLYCLNNPISIIDPMGLFWDTPTGHLKGCRKLITKKERCACMCIISSDFMGCEDTCNECSDGKTISGHAICMCTCINEGNTESDCRCFCGVFKK